MFADLREVAEHIRDLVIYGVGFPDGPSTADETTDSIERELQAYL